MSRSKENLNKSKSRENLDQKNKQSFAGEFADFYMGKRKAWLKDHVKKAVSLLFIKYDKWRKNSTYIFLRLME